MTLHAGNSNKMMLAPTPDALGELTHLALNESGL